MNQSEYRKKIVINEKMKEIVIARIEAQVPSDYKLYIGSYGGFNKEELIEHVRKGDEIGEFIVKSHISFMKALASGEFMRAVNSVENG